MPRYDIAIDVLADTVRDICLPECARFCRAYRRRKIFAASYGAVDPASGQQNGAGRTVPLTAGMKWLRPAGYWTIGYGHLCDPKHPAITEVQGEAYLAQDLRTALDATLRYCPVLATEPEGRLAAKIGRAHV